MMSTSVPVRLATAAVLVTAILLATIAGSAQPTAGQPAPGSIDLVSQTIDAEGRLQLQVRLFGADDATNIRVDLYTEIESRAAFIEGLETVDRAERRLFPRTTLQLSQLEPADDGTITLDVPSAANSPIQLDPGVHPVVVTLRSGTTVIDSLTTYVVVADPDTERPPLWVSLVAELDVPIGLQPNQQSLIDDDDRVALLRLLNLISRRPDSRFTLDMSTELVTAAISSDDDELVDALQAAVVDNEVLKAPWVPLDEVPLAHAGLDQLIDDAYALSDQILARDLDTTAVNMIRVDHDARRADLPILSTNTDYLLDLSQLSDRRAAPVYGPVLLTGSVTPALIVDQPLSNRINTSSDAELTTATMLAELELIAIETAPTQSGVIIEFGLANDSALIESLVDSIDQSTGFTTAPIDDIASLKILVDVDPPQRYLNPAATTDLSSFAQDWLATQSRVATFATVVAPADAPLAPLQQLLLASAATNLTEPRSEYLGSIATSIDAVLQTVAIAEPDRITLTSRDADLPITVLNGQGLPLNVAIGVASTTVELDTGDGGPYLATLQPGPTDLAVPVHVRATGDSKVTIVVTSPDGTLEMANASLDVRSTALSGLGLVISGLALAVLITWWVRSTLARRRTP